MGFILRWLAALGLLSATFNPTEWNYVSWAQANWGEQMALTVLLGLLLMVGYIIYLRATLRSIGLFGMLLGARPRKRTALGALRLWLAHARQCPNKHMARHCRALPRARCRPQLEPRAPRAFGPSRHG